MASNSTFELVLQDVGEETRQKLRSAWIDFLDSIVRGAPAMVIPKGVADDMGREALRETAKKFTLLCETDVQIIYDPSHHVIRIGSHNHVPFIFGSSRLLERVIYKVPEESPSPAPSTASSTSDSESEPESAGEDEDEEGSSTEEAQSAGETKDDATDKDTFVHEELSQKKGKSPNSWILYRAEKHSQVAKANPGMHNCKISKIISGMWKLESTEVKKHFADLAESRKRELLQEHRPTLQPPAEPSSAQRNNPHPVFSKGVSASAQQPAEIETDARQSKNSPASSHPLR